MKSIAKLFLLVFVTATLASGCEILSLSGDREVQSTLDHSFVQSEVTIIGNQFDIIAQSANNLKQTGTIESPFCDCAVIDLSQNAQEQYVVTVDFGQGCVCVDGRSRSGKLIGVFSDLWDTENVQLNITTDGYRITNLIGTWFDFTFEKTITRQDVATDQPVFNVLVTAAELTSEKGETITWSSRRKITLTEGAGDLDPSNNIYSITGTASGVARNEVAFDVEITEALILNATCNIITAGVVVLSPAEKTARTIDYGDGACDKEATVSIGDFTTTISLW
ncbi:MAG: hypothetical protein SF052_09660 [Bacteroidia bacterium]|nr:hypothetical protein [Bacteroidia bacterium]